MPADVGARRRVGLMVLVVAGFLLVAGAAMAYWSSAGTSAASASTGTLNAPTAVTASGVGSVTVSWTGSTGTTAPQGYYVVRTRTSDGVTAARVRHVADRPDGELEHVVHRHRRAGRHLHVRRQRRRRRLDRDERQQRQPDDHLDRAPGRSPPSRAGAPPARP